MKKTVESLIVLVLALLCLASCYKEEFKVKDVFPQVYVTQNGKMGMSFYIRASLPKDGTKAEVTSPDGSLVWQISVKSVSKDSVSYYGTSDCVMPGNTALPKGKYTYIIISKDGRTSEGSFEIDYTDVQGALSRAADTAKPYYDEISRLTVLGN